MLSFPISQPRLDWDYTWEPAPQPWVGVSVRGVGECQGMMWVWVGVSVWGVGECYGKGCGWEC